MAVVSARPVMERTLLTGGWCVHCEACSWAVWRATRDAAERALAAHQHEATRAG